MASFLYEMHMLGIIVVVFVILDWIFVLIKTSTVIMIPGRHGHLIERMGH